MAKYSLLSGTRMSVQSDPKHWFYTGVTGIKFDSIHISIKYHPTLLSLCLFFSDAMEKKQVKYCSVLLHSELFLYFCIVFLVNTTLPD